MAPPSSTPYSTDLSLAAKVNSEYKEQAYWDSRYQAEGTATAFDWTLKPDLCLPLLEELIPNKEARILMLGCEFSCCPLAMSAWRELPTDNGRTYGACLSRRNGTGGNSLLSESVCSAFSYTGPAG